MAEMPRVSRAELAARQKRGLEFIAKAGSIRGGLDAAGFLKSTQYRWLRDPVFKRKAEQARSKTVPATGEFPDLLGWRERHCAYYDQNKGVVRRAVNNWFQVDAYRNLTDTNRLILILPPGHIKTTFFGIEYSTWNIMRNPNVRITNIQRNAEEAAKVVGAVQQRLSDHDYYEELAGHLSDQGEEPISCPICAYGGDVQYKPVGRIGKQWGRYAFDVLGKRSGEKDPTMQARGAGGSIQGNRAELIILDDIQDPNNVTPDSTAKLMDWFRKVILGRIYDWQKLVILGNMIQPGDFISALIEEYGDNWPVIKYPAVLNDERQEILCPEVWTFGGLMEKKSEVGPDVWLYTWMQDEGAAEGATFRKETLHAALNGTRNLGHVPREVSDIVIGVDPAVRGFCAMVKWGVDRNTGKRYLIDLVNQDKMGNYPAIISRLVELCEKPGSPRTVVIETNNIQASLADDPRLRTEMARLGIRIEGYQTITAQGARAEQTDFSITTIAALYENGLVDLPYGDGETQKMIDAYIKQHCDWRAGAKKIVRDMVMATLFAEYQAREFARKRPKPPTRPTRAPDWVKNRTGGWRWARPAKEADDPKQTAERLLRPKGPNVGRDVWEHDQRRMGVRGSV